MASGMVTRGINNIYTVETEDGREYLCRIKGKKLRGVEEDRTPITVADRVTFDDAGGLQGVITGRSERTNQFTRYHLKRREVQTLFSNVDVVVCVVSTDQPPLKPGFIDRVIVCAGSIPVVIACNKADLGISSGQIDVLTCYDSLGFQVFRVSAETGSGVDALHHYITDKRSAFFGQSGVGKSSLVNRIMPGASQKTMEICRKYNKGRHTTNFSILLKSGDGRLEIIDTPGVREIEIPPMDPRDIAVHYPEFERFTSRCRFSPCLHIHEPDCSVRKAAETGIVDAGRYERYVRMTEDQVIRERSW